MTGKDALCPQQPLQEPLVSACGGGASVLLGASHPVQ